MPVSQSESELQKMVQDVTSHLNGKQVCRPGGLHEPKPSQMAEVFSLSPVHVGSLHTVPSAYIAQPPTPSHWPVWPQVDDPWSLQTLCGSAAPMSMGQQTPARSGRLHDTQAPVQAELQQTLSAQNPERQSSFLAHFAPGMRLPQLPVASHAWPSEHCACEVQLS